jgi:hypothetical protein
LLSDRRCCPPGWRFRQCGSGLGEGKALPVDCDDVDAQGLVGCREPLFQGSSNLSTVVGGACAFLAGNGSVGKPRAVRMPWTTLGSSRKAMTFIGPSQREQTMTSTANTRFSRAAQSRRYANRGGDGLGDEDGANEDCGASAQRGGLSLGDPYVGVQSHAIAHGDHVVALGVVLLQCTAPVVGADNGKRHQWRSRGRQSDQRAKDAGDERRRRDAHAFAYLRVARPHEVHHSARRPRRSTTVYSSASISFLSSGPVRSRGRHDILLWVVMARGGVLHSFSIKARTALISGAAALASGACGTSTAAGPDASATIRRGDIDGQGPVSSPSADTGSVNVRRIREEMSFWTLAGC